MMKGKGGKKSPIKRTYSTKKGKQGKPVGKGDCK